MGIRARAHRPLGEACTRGAVRRRYVGTRVGARGVDPIPVGCEHADPRQDARHPRSTSRPRTCHHVRVATPTPAELRDLALLRRVRDRIDRDYVEPLDVEALARGVHMSAGHLSRMFRRAFGESPYSYLMTRRIERAMLLLRHGDMSVTDIAIAVGCASLGTFSTRFTELVGVPPSVYRNRGADATTGMLPCVAKQVTRPIRNREAAGAARQ